MALSFYLPASAGQLSAGQGGFMALGAYTAAYLTVQHGTPFPLALAAGGLVGGLVGLAVGFPALRLPELLRWVKDWREIFYGLLVLTMMLVRPQGLLDAALLARLSPRGERAAARG